MHLHIAMLLLHNNIIELGMGMHLVYCFLYTTLWYIF